MEEKEDKNLKERILQILIDKVKEQINETKEEIENLREDIKSAPSRMESRYDSRRMELSYLQGATMNRLQEKYAQLSDLQNINVTEKSESVETGSLVFLSDNKVFFILPSQAGEKVKVENYEIIVLGNYSPLYTEILKGKKEGDAITYPSGEQATIIKII